MNPELIPLLAVGIALAGLIIGGQRTASAERRDLRDELRSEIHSVRDELRSEIHSVRDDLRAELRAVGERVNALESRIARLEGAFPFIAPRLPAPSADEDPDRTS